MHEKRIRSAPGLELVATVREICAKLPHTEEAIDKFGHTSFRVANKPFVIIGENEEAVGMSIKTDVSTQAVLMRQGAYTRTPYIGQHGWVSVEARSTLDWAQAEELIIDAYRRTAPKRFAAALPHSSTGAGARRGAAVTKGTTKSGSRTKNAAKKIVKQTASRTRK